MRILLTGVTGQVGQALRHRLQGLGTLLIADRSMLDLSRPDRIATALDHHAPDFIINPAAYTAVDQAEDEIDLTYRVNAEAPQALARWAARRGVPIVHFSTDYVFDGSGDRPFRETDAAGPLSVYGASKLAGENAVRDAGGAFLIVRTSWVFAASGRNFLTTMARLARERQQLRVVVDQVGAPTSARAIALGLSSILIDRAAGDRIALRPDLIRQFGEANGVVHVTTKGETSWHGFACAIVQGLRNRGASLAVDEIVAIESKDFPVKATRPSNSRLSLNRLESVFGVEMPNWQDALAFELDEFVRSAA